MPNTWSNYECKFNTANTANELPDSIYFVTANQMVRVAFVNLDPRRQALNQVVNVVPTICYLDPARSLHAAVMGQPDDSKITVESVVGDILRIKVTDYPKGRYLIGTAYRIPANGLVTFDFTNNNGVLSHVHVGHELKNLSVGKPTDEELKIALSRLQDAHELLQAGVPMSAIGDIITR